MLWTAEEAEEFGFASGNERYWLVVSREELIGIENKDFAPLLVLASSDDQPSLGEHLDLSPFRSEYDGFYLANLKNRGDPEKYPEDPYVLIREDSPKQCVYAEGSIYDNNQILKAEGGMDVFISGTMFNVSLVADLYHNVRHKTT